MSQFSAIFATIFLISACSITLGLGDSSSGGGGGSSLGVASPKNNVRILSPAATKLYRMIRRGQLDDDDLFTEDENNFRKRQYDDYGHMRFGKRNPQPKDFDDYGHLRFGRK